ncbi:MAG TPA: amidohydrolase family protein [Chloroflexota bacterium]|nr:amidohydrolase family protein [Chloroflexota bacterium]
MADADTSLHPPVPGPRLQAVQRARVLGAGGLVDIALAGERVAAVVPTGMSPPPGEPVLDVGGRAVLPAFVEPHIHLDKAYLLDRLEAAGLPAGTLAEAIASTARLKPTFTRTDLRARAERALHALLRHGCTAARVHVEIEPIVGLLGVEVHLELAAAYAGVFDLQLVAFPQDGIQRLPGVAELLEEALRLGCHVVGGCPYVDPDPAAHIDQVFALAERWGRPVDFHLDFSDDPHEAWVDHVCARARALGMQGRVAVGHLTSLAAMPPAEAAPRIAALVEAGVAVIALPATDLYLSGRRVDHAPPRGITRLRELHAAGVLVALGNNNLQNAFTPVGNGNPLQMAWLAGLAGQLGTSAEQRLLLEMVTTLPARILGLPPRGPTAGARADLVVLECIDPLLAVREVAPVAAVLRAGQLLPRPPSALPPVQLVAPASTPPAAS